MWYQVDDGGEHLHCRLLYHVSAPLTHVNKSLALFWYGKGVVIIARTEIMIGNDFDAE